MTSSRHILVLSSSYPRTRDDDTSVFIQRTCQAMATRVKELSVIIPQDGDEPGEEIRNGAALLRFKYGLFSKGRLAFGASLLSNIKQNPLILFQVPLFVIQMLRRIPRGVIKPDGIIAFWILSAVPALLFHLATGTPYILALRGSDALIFKSRVLSKLAVPFLRCAKRVVTVSETLRDLVAQSGALPSNGITVIPNGVAVPELRTEEIASFAAQNGLQLDKHYLLTVTSLRPMKRIEVLIELLSKLPEFELVLCGKTDLTPYVTELKRVATDLDCAKRVHFLGSRPPGDVFRLMRMARAYLTASTWEGQPNAVLEALASELPVFASDIPAHRELLRDGENGVIFNVESLEILAARIREVDGNEKLRNSLIEKGRQTAAHRSWDSCAAAYLELFENRPVSGLLGETIR